MAMTIPWILNVVAVNNITEIITHKMMQNIHCNQSKMPLSDTLSIFGAENGHLYFNIKAACGIILKYMHGVWRFNDAEIKAIYYCVIHCL